VASAVEAHEIAFVLGLSEPEATFFPADRAVVGGDSDWADTQHRCTDE